MITKTIKLYKFDELSKEVQQKVIEKHKEQEDHFGLSDMMQEELRELLRENEIDGDGKVFYSLSYCQGDGAMFEGKFYWKGLSIVVKHSGHYYHSYSKTIDITDENGEEVDSPEFEKVYQSICEKLESFGYGIIEQDLDDERIREVYLDGYKSHYTFREDGVVEFE